MTHSLSTRHNRLSWCVGRLQSALCCLTRSLIKVKLLRYAAGAKDIFLAILTVCIITSFICTQKYQWKAFSDDKIRRRENNHMRSNNFTDKNIYSGRFLPAQQFWRVWCQHGSLDWANSNSIIQPLPGRSYRNHRPDRVQVDFGRCTLSQRLPTLECARATLCH